MDKDKLEKNHYCDNVNCNHYNTNGLCCLFNPDNCKYRQLQKENAELNKKLSDAETNYDKMFWQKIEIISNAKEIIKTLAANLSMYSGNYQRELLEAEQFLKKEE